MRVLRKINIGFLLTVIVVISLCIYCVNIELSRKKEKEPIQEAAQDFLNVVDKYLVLPKEYQKVDVKIDKTKDKSNFDSYYDELKKDLKNVMNREQSIDIQMRVIEYQVSSQIDETRNIRLDYTKKITKIRSYVFDDNQVSIQFDAKVTIKTKYLDENFETGEKEEKEKEKSFNTTYEEMTLEKVDNKWKVVYANLQYEDLNGYEYESAMF